MRHSDLLKVSKQKQELKLEPVLPIERVGTGGFLRHLFTAARGHPRAVL